MSKYGTHSVTWLNAALVLCTGLIIAMVVMLFQHRTETLELRSVENEKWNQMLLAADVGQWRWNVTRDELKWDDAIKRIYGIEDKAFVPSYSTFADQLDPADLGWVNQVVQKTLNEKGSYRAVFKLKNGRFIRAYGKVITKQNGDVIFSGVCMPADASEYTGKPIAFHFNPASNEL